MATETMAQMGYFVAHASIIPRQGAVKPGTVCHGNASGLLH